MTNEEWGICTRYVGDPTNIIGVISVTKDGGLGWEVGPSNSDIEGQEKSAKLNEVAEWGIHGRNWQKVALIGVPVAFLLAGLGGWYFGGRKCRV